MNILRLMIGSVVLASPLACGLLSTEPDPQTIVFTGAVRSAVDGSRIEGARVIYGLDDDILPVGLGEDFTDSRGWYNLEQRTHCDAPFRVYVEVHHVDYLAARTSLDVSCSDKRRVVDFELTRLEP